MLRVWYDLALASLELQRHRDQERDDSTTLNPTRRAFAPSRADEDPSFQADL